LVESVAGRSRNGRGREAGGSSAQRSVGKLAGPVVEGACVALARYLAEKGAALVRERLLPRFLETVQSGRSA
jgi:hypothetical protein